MKYIDRNIIDKAVSDKVNILVSTHSKLSLPIINRIYNKMINGIKFDDIKVCNNMIIDGHHRYVSSLLANIEIGKTKTLKTSATKVYDWSKVEFLDEEWDTKEKIKLLNQKDAEYNNLPIEEIIKMLE